MNKFSELIKKRRSTRKFTEKLLTPAEVENILKAGLMAPSSKSTTPWEFVAVEDKTSLEKLSLCKEHGSKLIANSALAIIVIGDPSASDVWVEDTSIASIMMQLQAEDLGLGSCWVQIRGRYTDESTPAEDYIKNMFGIPPHLHILSVIAFGHKVQDRPPFDEEKLQWEKVHIGKY